MLHGAWTSSHPVHLSCWALGTMRPCSTTTLTLTALLCLGLCRGPQDLVQAGVLPKPSIWADPGPVVPKGSRVIIWCQGSLQAEAYSLFKGPGSQVLDTRIPKDSSNKTGFLIEPMSATYAGRYQCAYYTRRNSWSERSDSLSLVVTGTYDAPSLSVQPGPSVSWGENVTLQCRSETSFDNFHLHKVGSPAPPRHLRLRDTAAPSQANFHISPVTSAHGGTYRCYGSRSTSPYLLSHASDPLQLVVSGAADFLEPSKNNSDTKTASDTQEYTVGNLTRMGVAGLILVVLGMLLFEAWHSQRRTHSAARTETQRHPTIQQGTTLAMNLMIPTRSGKKSED